MISAPARVGAHVSEIDTPALLIELDALERNIARMQDRIAGTRLRLRPHAKTHKSTAIANLQLAAGAVGVCCQKVSEAEIMVDGGIGDVLISNEVVGAAKLDRAAALARRAKIAVCVDDSENVEQIAAGRSRAQPTRFPIPSTCCGGMASNAGSSPAPAPALSSSRSQAASMTS